MKQLYKILMLFFFVYATFALGKEVYTNNQISVTDLADDTTDLPLVEGMAPVAVVSDLADVSADDDASRKTVKRSTPTRTTNNQQPQLLDGNQISGHFLMGTDDASAVYWGTYDSTTNTLLGEVSWYGNPTLRRVGNGTYIPTGQDSGSLSIHFQDPANSRDLGLDWTGTYGNGRWTIVTPTAPGSLTGRVFQAPQ